MRSAVKAALVSKAIVDDAAGGIWDDNSVAMARSFINYASPVTGSSTYSAQSLTSGTAGR